MQNNLTKSNNMTAKIFAFCMVLVAAITCAINPAFALDTTGVSTVMEYVIQIISTASLYVGIIISVWGIFQIILAMRREDSEGISKQITTIVVGAVLLGLGAGLPGIVSALGG